MPLASFGLTLLLAGFTGHAIAQTPPGGLEGTAWSAVELAGTQLPLQSPAGDREPHLVFAAARVSGSDGCNRFTGPYAVKKDRVTIGQLAATRMFCPQSDEMARRFQAALKGTSRWKIVAGRLEFYGATGKPLAVFERIYNYRVR